MTPLMKHDLIHEYWNMGLKVFYCPSDSDVFYHIIECREYLLLGYAIKIEVPKQGTFHYRLSRVSLAEIKYLTPVVEKAAT